MKLLMLAVFSAVSAIAFVSVRGPRLAPEGTMFLLEPGMIRTEVGVTGFAAGTQVQVVAEAGEYIAVEVEGFEFHVPRRKLTNILEVAARVSAQDRQTQQTAARLVHDQRVALRQQYAQQAIVHEKRQQELALKRASRGSLSSGALNRSAYAEKFNVAKRPIIYWVSAP
jgi:Fe2+ transport system protein FeoA